jgi:hypothetical protein
LDEILVLRTIDLSSLDISSVEALCFFVNVYHTLLQHARIVLGAPDKKVSRHPEIFLYLICFVTISLLISFGISVSPCLNFDAIVEQ